MSVVAPGFHVTTRTAPVEGQEQGEEPPLHMLCQATTPAAAAACWSAPSAAVQEAPDLRDRGKALEQAATSGDFPRVVTPENPMTAEEESVCHQIVQALDLRWKWLFRSAVQPHHDQARTVCRRCRSLGLGGARAIAARRRSRRRVRVVVMSGMMEVQGKDGNPGEACAAGTRILRPRAAYPHATRV